MSTKSENLAWLDLEMTGLVPERDVILEIATIVTDKDLNILAEGPVIPIFHVGSVLDQMDEWCTKTHGESGLIERVKNSKYDTQQAEAETIAFLEKYVEPGKSPLAGNSICQDRRFMAHWMPKLEAFFHYRNLDVSTVKELARRWSPKVFESHQKAGKHQALDDIKDSISELIHYREHFFRFPAQD